MLKKIFKTIIACSIMLLFCIPANVYAAVVPSNNVYSASALYYYLNYYGTGSSEVASYDGSTVTLHDDITLTTNLYIFPSGTDIVLNLNGHTLSTTKAFGISDSTNSGGSFCVNGYSTENRGYIKLTGTSKYNYILCTNDTLELDNVIISNNENNTAPQVIKATGGNLVLNNDSVWNDNEMYVLNINGDVDADINGCNFETNTTSSSYPTINVQNTADVSIVESEIFANTQIALLNNGGTVNIDNSTVLSDQEDVSDGLVSCTSGSLNIKNSKVGDEDTKVAIKLDGEDVSFDLNNVDVNATKYGLYAYAFNSITMNNARINAKHNNKGIGTYFIKTENNTVLIKNGTFSGDVSGIAYVDENYPYEYVDYYDFLDEDYMTLADALTFSTTYKAYVNTVDTTIEFYPGFSSIDLSETEFYYNGEIQRPDVYISDAEGNELIENEDYIVTYVDSIDVGTYEYLISFINKYEGDIVFEYTILSSNITSAELDNDYYIYDGNEYKPDVDVYYEDKKLTKDIDYTVTYENDCINIGTKKVVINGIGNYSGTITKEYLIAEECLVDDDLYNGDNSKDSTALISAISKVTLSATSYTYNGKVHYPTINVYAGSNKLTKGTDYTTNTYTNNKKPGTYTIKVTGKGKYSGSISRTYKIVVKSTKVKSLSRGKKLIKVYWNKLTSTYVSGYQIEYSTSKTFKTAKFITVSGASHYTKTIKGLKPGKKYYVRIRAYKTISNKKYYSPWSGYKSITTK